MRYRHFLSLALLSSPALGLTIGPREVWENDLHQRDLSEDQLYQRGLAYFEDRDLYERLALPQEVIGAHLSKRGNSPSSGRKPQNGITSSGSTNDLESNLRPANWRPNPPPGPPAGRPALSPARGYIESGSRLAVLRSGSPPGPPRLLSESPNSSPARDDIERGRGRASSRHGSSPGPPPLSPGSANLPPERDAIESGRRRAASRYGSSPGPPPLSLGSPTPPQARGDLQNGRRLGGPRLDIPPSPPPLNIKRSSTAPPNLRYPSGGNVAGPSNSQPQHPNFAYHEVRDLYERVALPQEVVKAHLFKRGNAPSTGRPFRPFNRGRTATTTQSNIGDVESAPAQASARTPVRAPPPAQQLAPVPPPRGPFSRGYSSAPSLHHSSSTGSLNIPPNTAGPAAAAAPGGGPGRGGADGPPGGPGGAGRGGSGRGGSGGPPGGRGGAGGRGGGPPARPGDPIPEHPVPAPGPVPGHGPAQAPNTGVNIHGNPLKNKVKYTPPNGVISPYALRQAKQKLTPPKTQEQILKEATAAKVAAGPASADGKGKKNGWKVGSGAMTAIGVIAGAGVSTWNTAIAQQGLAVAQKGLKVSQDGLKAGVKNEHIFFSQAYHGGAISPDGATAYPPNGPKAVHNVKMDWDGVRSIVPDGQPKKKGEL